MKYYALEDKKLITVLKYLSTRPYGEVAQIINDLQTLPIVDINEPKPEEITADSSGASN